jgi:hypothetical protein
LTWAPFGRATVDFFVVMNQVPRSGFGCFGFCIGLGFGQSFDIG